MADADLSRASPTGGRDGSRGVRRRPHGVGPGLRRRGQAVGELCFNTAMTGYQEVMTDPCYAKQVIAFTFPHIGNVGANDEDVEAAEAHALGCLVREVVTEPSNYRAEPGLCRLDAQMGPDRHRRGRYARADQAGAERRPADDRHRASAPRASSTSTRCRGWRRTGRGSRAWTSPRTSAGCRSSAGPAANGRGGRAMRGLARERRGGEVRQSPSEPAAGEGVPTSSRSIMAPSATSSATWSRPGRG